jgi:hypothetical protein
MRTFSIGLLLLSGISIAAVAQIKNTSLPIASAGPFWQTAVAMHPKNPANVVVAVAPGTVLYSIDGGTSWQPGSLTTAAGPEGEVSMVADGKGDFYYIQTSGNQMVCHVSKDGGKTWDVGSPVIGPDPTKKNLRQTATIDARGTLHLTYTQFDNYPSDAADCRSAIFLTQSSNGKKWSKPREISQVPGRCNDGRSAAAGAYTAVAYDGKSYVVWLNNQTIFMDRAFDGSTWLSTDITVTKLKGDKSYSNPILLADRSKGPRQGSLYLTWSDTRAGKEDADIWFMRSTNYGDNWTSPQRVNDDTPVKHQYQPAMAIDQATGFFYILYFDRRAYDDNQTDVYLACSTDGGNTFKNKKISETSFAGSESWPEFGYTGLAAHKGIITPVWIRTNEGKPEVWTATLKQEEFLK